MMAPASWWGTWRRLLVPWLVATLWVLALAPADGAAWPERDITVVVSYAAGGGTDITLRALGPAMSRFLGVNLIFVNMPGGDGAVAAEYVLKQPKDGYTVLGLSSATEAYPATGISNITYRDYQMIGMAGGGVAGWTVAAHSPMKDARDLIAALKRGNLTMATSGVGTAWYLPSVLLARAVGGSFTAVPYGGGFPSVVAASKGEVDFAASDVAEAIPLLQEKRVRALAYMGRAPRHIEGYGDVPSILEPVPELEPYVDSMVSWRGMAYARGVPEGAFDRMIAAFEQALKSEEFLRVARTQGIVISGLTGERAQRAWARGTAVQSWLIFDLGEAKRAPAEVGIPRP